MSKEKIKNFIIDTNVLLFDPEAIFRLENNNVIIPDIVLEELDHFKSEQTERGQNSRKVSRYLDELKDKGSFEQGIPLGKNKGKLFISFTDIQNKEFKYDLTKYDNRILYLCKNLTKNLLQKINNVILITKDVNLRVKASTLGIISQDYLNDKIIQKDDQKYTGRRVVFLSSKSINNFLKNQIINIDELLNAEGKPLSIPLLTNEFLEIYASDTNNKSAVLGRYDGEKVVPLRYSNYHPKGISPRNIGQRFMIEALMQPPDVAPLVIIKGIAGTAKTFFALATGLDSYANKKNKDEYNRILICRPSVCMDEEIGYLPGSEKEKISPYMRAIKDNVFTIYNGDKAMDIASFKNANDEVEIMFEEDFIKTEALAFQRGRSLNHYWFILDEMQNSTVRQAKGIITRGGVGTKIILLGDPEQIDSPYLDSQTNGLTYASEKMKGSPLCWQVTLKDSECERSPLALEAAQRL